MSLITSILDTQRKRPIEYYITGARCFVDCNTILWASRSIVEKVSCLGCRIYETDHHEIARKYFNYDRWSDDIFLRKRWMGDANLSVVAAWCCKLWFLCNSPADDYAIWLDAGCAVSLLFDKDIDAARRAIEGGFRLDTQRLVEFVQTSGRDVLLAGNGLSDCVSEIDIATRMAVAGYFIAVKSGLREWLWEEFRNEMNRIIESRQVYTDEYALAAVARKHGIEILPLMKPVELMMRR